MDDFDDAAHMNEVGEFYFNVNETMLLADKDASNLTKNDNDARNPVAVSLMPSDMSRNEGRS